jgi:hypothetical protein
MNMFIVIIFFHFLILNGADETESTAYALSQLIAVFFILFSVSLSFLVFIFQVISHISLKPLCVFLSHCLHEQSV